MHIPAWYQHDCRLSCASVEWKDLEEDKVLGRGKERKKKVCRVGITKLIRKSQTKKIEKRKSIEMTWFDLHKHDMAHHVAYPQVG